MGLSLSRAVKVVAEYVDQELSVFVGEVLTIKAGVPHMAEDLMCAEL